MDQNNQLVKTGGRFNSAFTQPLFRSICILVTIAFALSAFSITVKDGMIRFNVSFNIIWLLLMIAVWFIYGNAKKGASPLMGMKIVSGVVKAQYIITYIVCGVLIFWAVIYGLVFGVLGFDPAEVSKSATDFISQFYTSFNVSFFFAENSALMFIITSVVIAVVCVVGIIVNALVLKKVHKFTKSACLVEDGKAENVECANVARGWYIATGIFAAVINGYNLAALVMKSVNVSRFSGIDSLTIISERISLLTALPAVVSGIIISVVFFLFSKWIKNNRDILQ